MNIDSYTFGKITIDGKTYTNDVIIFPKRIKSSWWRKEGHLLQTADLLEVFDENPDILIIGTGHSGSMRVPEETKGKLTSNDIKYHIKPTTEAVDIYNNRPRDKKVVAALHLTC